MEPTTDASPTTPAWRRTVERNALWFALGALAFFALVVVIGVRVAPEVFYDRFWWEDIYGPLVVDAHQCKTAASCPGLEGPAGITVKDGYTVTSELTYGLVLAVLLYGIYVGLFRRYGIKADGWFVLGLMPWIMLGPLARVLEDADVFCRAGTHCDPGPFAFVFISPVIYVQIALYVIGAMLLGVWIERHRERGARRLTPVVGGALLLGFFSFLVVERLWGDTFSALPPSWFVLLTCAAGIALFHWRATRGQASMNLVVFVLGLPWALNCLWLIGWWLSGHTWSDAAWNDQFYFQAGGFILGVAAAAALIVWGLSRVLVQYGVERRWAAATERIDAAWEKRLAYAGLALLAFALLAAGVVPRLAAFFTDLPSRERLIPLAAGLGALALLGYAFLTVGRGAHERPGILLVFGAGISLALVFGHVMDGVATWVALEDPFHFGLPQYSEKHPFSEFLLRYWNGFLFPATKLAMVFVVVWALERETRADRPDDRNLVGLVKMAIFVLGFAPGLRDVMRLTMGV